MRIPTWIKSVLVGFLCFAVVFTGIPLVPGTSVKEAKAAIPLRVNPAEVNAIYGGQADITWQFQGDPFNPELTSHFTTIKLQHNGEETILHTATYPINQDITYVWNGKWKGQTAKDGLYTIEVVPAAPYDQYSRSFQVEVFNPHPPAPIMEIAHFETEDGKKDLYNDQHIIRGVAEIGTKVFLKIQTCKREGNNTRVCDNEERELGPKEGVSVSATPRQSSWAKAIQVPEDYFTNFPYRADNTPEQYLGEWEVAVTLPAYEIADITAYVFRDFEEKTSEIGALPNSVLRYKSPAWVKWAIVASYYYNVITDESIRDRIEYIGAENGFVFPPCQDGQPCYFWVDKDINLLIKDPVQAGLIGDKDIQRIEDDYARKYGHPLADYFDPINMATGDFDFTHTNIEVDGRLPLSFRLTYHSRDQYNGDVGVGWHHSFERHLEPRENGILYLVTPDGASVRYEPNGDGTYKRPLGVYDTLMKNADGTYTQETPQKWKYIYREDGLLYRIMDPNGNTIRLTYNGSLLMKAETDGASLSFVYGEGGKIVRVEDHTGRSVKYSYDQVDHLLLSMALPDGAVIRFEYDDKNRMTAIHNPNETTSLINVYDDQDRVIRQRDFYGNWGDIHYDPASRKTEITDQLGRKKTFEYDERQRKTAVHYPDGTTERFEYDANDNLQVYTDRNGQAWRNFYDSMGNLIETRDPLGNRTLIAYNSLNLPVKITDALGHETELRYDTKGNLTEMIDALGQSTKITVDARGTPTSVTNAEGETVRLNNNSYGFVQSIIDAAGFKQEYIRDPLHRVTETIDALGNRTKIEYDPRDRVTAVIDALGGSERYTYDKDSNFTGTTDAAGAHTKYVYDNFDRVTAVTDALGQTTRYEYDAVGNLVKMIAPSGAVTRYEYNNVDQLIKVTDAEGYVTEFSYDGNGNLVTRKEPGGGMYQIVYDARNLPTAIINPDGGQISYRYDALGRLVEQTDPLGNRTTYEYDAIGQLICQIDALGHVTSFKYDRAGRLIETMKPNGAIWKMTYDKRGLLTRITDPYGKAVSMSYDAAGWMVSYTDEAGQTTRYQYDALGRVTRITNPLGHATTFTYDARGLVTGVVDAKGQTTSYDYDLLGRLVEVTNALNDKTRYGYDAMGNIVTKTDALSRQTMYEYNLRDELIRQINPLQQITELAYDGNGNVTSIRYPDGKSTNYRYDQMNRLTNIIYPDQQVTYAYDLAGRRTRMTDSIGTTHYAYDALNRLISVTDAYEQTIRYEWTPTHQRSKVIYPDQSVVSYQYDLLDRMTAVTDGDGLTTTYAYDARGLLVSKYLPTQGGSTYQYDAAGQLLGMTHRNQFGKLLEQLTYTYDPVGNRIRMERHSDENDEDDEDAGASKDLIVTEYAYDALNQLVQVQTRNAAKSELPILTTYTYDAVGNRLAKSSMWGDVTETESYTYNAADHLIQWTNGTSIKDYIYDPRGNLLKVLERTLDLPKIESFGLSVPDSVYGMSIVDSVYGLNPVEDEMNLPDVMSMGHAWSDPEIIEQYAWNDAGRLIQQINHKGDISKYFYDGDGNRVKMTIDVARGPNPGGNGNNGNGNGNGNGKGNNGNGNGKGNGNGNPPCHVVPPGFIPPGLAKKCGQYDEEYPDMHPGGPRDGWEKQHQKKHWELLFTNDVSLALPEPIQVTEADSTKWKQTYVYGAGGERISMSYLPAYDPNNGWEPYPGAGGAEPGTAAKKLWYLADPLGSVIGLVEKDGRMSARYHYDEFGVVLDAKKFDLNWPGPDNLFGYTSLPYEYYSGLTYARARYYQPEIGRFISEDTYKGELWNPQSQNLYAYVWNNPLKYQDPSGHFAIPAIVPFIFEGVKAAVVATAGYFAGKAAEELVQKPKVIQQPKVEQGPTVIIQPSVVQEKPIVNQQPVVEQKQTVSQQIPVAEQKPIVIQQPVVNQGTSVVTSSNGNGYTVPEGGGGISNAIQVGGITVTFGHGGRRNLGMPVQQVEEAIARDVVNKGLASASVGQLPRQTVIVNGKQIEYRPYNRGNGIVNVGTYVPY